MEQNLLTKKKLKEKSIEYQISFANLLEGFLQETLMFQILETDFAKRLWLKNREAFDLDSYRKTANFTKASVAGSGTAILSGSTQEAEYSVAGSGDLFASDFVAKKASASVAGSGDIKCHATDFLKVRTSGSGSVGYKGNPELDYPKKGLYKL